MRRKTTDCRNGRVNSMKILGIDPGLISMGWAFIDTKDGKIDWTSGEIRANQREDLTLRLAFILDELKKGIELRKPDVVAMESGFVGGWNRGTLATAYARGMVLCAAGNAKMPLYEYAPSSIKKNLTGHGNSSKEQLAHAVASFLGDPMMTLKPDQADALAVALNCYRVRGQQGAMI